MTELFPSIFFYPSMKYTSLKFFIAFSIAVTIISCTKNTEPVSNAPPTNFHGIPPQGIGGDSLLNIKKNRWFVPQEYTDMAIGDMINLPHDILTAIGSEERSKWTPADSAQAAVSEAKGIRVTGSFINVREEGNESCNGNDSSYHDFHLWIADSSGKGESGSIIAEATPFWKEQFPKWQLSTLENLANSHTPVRISGWIMWDEDHPEYVGSSRASLWEIHPMTKFEYFNGTSWVALQ
jgi:hypothetical protein